MSQAIRGLIALLLVEVFLFGALGLVAWTSGLLFEKSWRTEALVSQAELQACQKRRR